MVAEATETCRCLIIFVEAYFSSVFLLVPYGCVKENLVSILRRAETFLVATTCMLAVWLTLPPG
jgi:hypothetical protein